MPVNCPGEDGDLAEESHVADLRDLPRMRPGERLAALGTTAAGLSSAEAAVRLQHLGPNEPIRPDSTRLLRSFAGQFTHTLALLLWFASGIAFAAGIAELGSAIVAVVVLNGAFAFIQEYRAGKVLESLMRRVAVTARVSRDGAMDILPAASLVPGDIVHLATGDVIPADCALLESENLTVDLSMLTGETQPVERSAEPVEVPEGRLRIETLPPLLPGGAWVATGSASAVVVATGPSSSLGRIAGLLHGLSSRPSVLERQVAALSRVTAAIAVLAGAATLALAASFTETSTLSALTFSTGIIVALVPEGLLPTLSVSLAIGARRMAERGAAIRRLSAVEVVGSATVICTDKTGTLTENTITVKGAVSLDGSQDPSLEMLQVAALCNDAVAEGDAIAGDALDSALLRWVEGFGIDPAAWRSAHARLSGTPFDARKRYMEVTCAIDGSPTVLVKGAPEAVLPLTSTGALPPALARAVAEATSAGDRVLLLARGAEGRGLHPAGIVRFGDPPRAGVADALAACRNAGIRVVMLTGDHPETARAVARTVGLVEGAVPVETGDDVDRMSDADLLAFLASNAVIARVDPQQKLRVVRVLQSAGEVVVVTGDGVNDAPALRAADVGVAMGLRGTEVAKQAADIVLADDNFATIVAAIEEGRSIRANIRRFLSYIVTSNVAEMAPFLLYIFLPIPLPLAVIQALAVDIGTDLLPALALGAEPPAPGVMRAAPEPPSRPLLTRRLGLRTFLFFGPLEAAIALAGFFAFYLVEGWRFGDSFAPFEGASRAAATVTFLGIVGGQVGCLVAQRDGTLRQRLSLANRAIAVGLAFEICLVLVLLYVPGLNRAVSMAAIDPAWLLTIPLAALTFMMCDELRRALGRSLSRATTAGGKPAAAGAKPA